MTTPIEGMIISTRLSSAKLSEAPLHRQASFSMMPICVICSDPLCRINEVSMSEEEVVVWVKCGHCFHRRCIDKLIRLASDATPPCQAKCPYCSAPPSPIRNCDNPACTCPYYARVYLPTEKPEAQAILPLDIVVKGTVKARLNIVAIAQYIGMEVDELIKRLEKDQSILKKDSEEYWRIHGKSVGNMQQYISREVRKIQLDLTEHRESFVYKMLQNLDDSITPLIKAITEAGKSSRLRLDLEDSIKALLAHHNFILRTIEEKRTELTEMKKDTSKYMLVEKHQAERKKDREEVEKLTMENLRLKERLSRQTAQLACARIERDVARSLHADDMFKRQRSRISNAPKAEDVNCQLEVKTLQEQAAAINNTERYPPPPAEATSWLLSGRLRNRILIPRTKPLFPVSAILGLDTSPPKLFDFGATTLPGMSSLKPQAKPIKIRQAGDEGESDEEYDTTARAKRTAGRSRRSLRQRGLRAVKALPRKKGGHEPVAG